MTDNIEIGYSFTTENGKQLSFDLIPDPITLNLEVDINDSPDWTRLTFHQCSNCPLKPDEHPLCPAANALVNVVNLCDELASYDQVDVRVVTKERVISQRTTAQRAISALMGLLIATSGCPQSSFFKPMARFHLPLSSEEETIYRVSSMYLLGQYFRKLEGKEADTDFSGLQKVYEDLQLVNVNLAKRLRAASGVDSSVNAIVLLDLFAQAIPMALDESLIELRYLFQPYVESQDDRESK